MKFAKVFLIFLLISFITISCTGEIMSTILVDSYSESNFNTATGIGNTYADSIGESFTGKAGDLVACKFMLIRDDGAEGEIAAKLYAHSGTFGSSSIPTGEALATSGSIDVSMLSSSYQLITFNFTGAEQYTLVEGTKYCILVEYVVGKDEAGNHIGISLDTTSPSHNGNYFKYYEDEYSYNSAVDTIFYVYAEEPEPDPIPEPDPETPITTPDVLAVLKPVKLKRTKEINGAWRINMTCLPDDNIAAEGYLNIDSEEYIIKKYTQTKEGSVLYDVEAYNNFLELGNPGSTIDRFYRTDTVTNLLTYILDGSYWVAGDCDINQTLVFKVDKRVSRLEALNLLATQAGGELNWDSINRTVDLNRQIGTNTGLHIRVDKNATFIKREVDSSDLITRLFPYGPDNFPINSTTVDDCEDDTLYAGSGGLVLSASNTIKMNGKKAITLTATALNETAIRDLDAAVVDLSDHDSLKFWVYSATANANGLTFGIGESAYDELTVNTGALEAGCWHEIELDLSATANASKNAIRYIGFKNLTDGAAEVIFDNIRAFYGNTYIDSPNIYLYKYIKEAAYYHSARQEKTAYETIIYPDADSYVNEDSPNTNYGSSSVIKIRSLSTEDYISYIKFLLSSIPAGATITSATLNLNVASTDFTSGGTVDVELAATNWDSSTITYTNRPASAGKETDFEANSAGWKEIDITSTVQDWYSGATDNFGLKLDLNIASVNKAVNISSSESADKPYLEVEYTLETDPSPIIVAAAEEYLAAHDEPKISYKVKAVDLSKVMVDTWESETISLGDTIKVYDVDLNLNTEVRVIKITENLLDPSDLDLELGNKAYSIVDRDVSVLKQLSYAMPFDNDLRIIDANAVQVGYLGISQ